MTALPTPQNLSWQDQLRRLTDSDTARSERSLFKELNPDLAFAPIMKAPPATLKPAAVMIPVIARPSEPSVLFTVRPTTMPSHAGEISFPGGGPKQEDRHLIDTAVRETQEEVGIGPKELDIVGTFGPHHGGRGFIVTPVLSMIPDGVTITPCAREVAEVFEVPLSHLINLDNHIVEEREARGVRYRMFAIPYQEKGEVRHIWGLTAGILHTLAKAYDDIMRSA